MDKLLGLLDFLFGVGHDKAMQIFFLVAGVSGVRTAFAFLDRSLATNGDLCLRFGFCQQLLAESLAAPRESA